MKPDASYRRFSQEESFVVCYLERMEQTYLSQSTHSFSGLTLGQYPLLVKNLMAVKKAAAQTHLDLSELSPELATQIMKACENHEHHLDKMVADPYQGGGAIAINMNINEAIVENVRQSNQHTNITISDVNKSQSTADVCASAIRISIHQHCLELSKALKGMSAEFEKKHHLFANIESQAITCMRPAVKVPLGEKFLGYSQVIDRCTLDLDHASEQLTAISLGGTVVGSSEGASLKYVSQIVPALAKELDLPLTQKKNLFDAAQNMDDIARVSHALNMLARIFIKTCKDLRFLSYDQQIRIPTNIKGSSFFKNKENPTLEETLIQASMDVIGQTTKVDLCLQEGELDLNVFDFFAGFSLLECLPRYRTIIEKYTRHSLEKICLPN